MEAEKPLEKLLASAASGQPSAPPSLDPVPFPPIPTHSFIQLKGKSSLLPSRLCHRSEEGPWQHCLGQCRVKTSP